MKIVGVQNYEGKFKNTDGNFLILVERLDGFDLLLIAHNGIKREGHWDMASLPN